METGIGKLLKFIYKPRNNCLEVYQQGMQFFFQDICGKNCSLEAPLELLGQELFD